MREILAFVDCLSIIVGVFMAEVLRFGEGHTYFLMGEYSVWKIIVVGIVIQIDFYFFDLYNPIYFQKRGKVALLLLESLGISYLLLAIVYYSIPHLAMGRGVLGLSLIAIYALGFFSRLILAELFRSMIKERVLIVGTGRLSQKLVGDISKNGGDSFEIIGFVEE